MIKIITDTTFGYWNGRFVEPKNKNCEPFKLDPEREAELVTLGIAAYVDEEAEQDREAKPEAEQNEEAKQEEDINQDEEADSEDPEELTAESLASMKLQDLKALAEPLGVKFEVGMKKSELAQHVFEAVQAAESADESLTEENPLSFDPAQAIV